ncbi:MAG TPA: hypothetical protein VGB89_12755 [Bacteroidota bacterium]
MIALKMILAAMVLLIYMALASQKIKEHDRRFRPAYALIYLAPPVLLLLLLAFTS